MWVNKDRKRHHLQYPPFNRHTMVDILVLGATGYTGKLIVEYLHQHPQRLNPGFTLALAARSTAKLNNFAQTLELGSDVELWTLDVSNKAELEIAIRKAKVVINTVGPFWTQAFPTVESVLLLPVHGQVEFISCFTGYVRDTAFIIWI